MKVNTYGLKISGFRKIASESKCLPGGRGNSYIEIFYDKSTGECWSKYHCSLGGNSWTEYHDPNIIRCGFWWKPLTMQEVINAIYNTVNNLGTY